MHDVFLSWIVLSLYFFISWILVFLRVGNVFLLVLTKRETLERERERKGYINISPKKDKRKCLKRDAVDPACVCVCDALRVCVTHVSCMSSRVCGSSDCVHVAGVAVFVYRKML